MVSSCDYCGGLFDYREKGVHLQAESGGLTVWLNGAYLAKSDEVAMSLCSLECFRQAQERVAWGYTEEDLPLCSKSVVNAKR